MEYFPRNTENTAHFEQQIELTKSDVQLDNAIRKNQIVSLQNEMEADRLMNSYLGQLGKVVEPVMRPLGFDWKMSIALLAGLPAKEIIISTMGVLYQTQGDDTTVNLQNKLQNERFENGKRKNQVVFTTPTALAFLIFILIYFPCVGVVATIKNESGTWKWAVFAILYTTSLAWIAAFVVYNISKLIL